MKKSKQVFEYNLQKMNLQQKKAVEGRSTPHYEILLVDSLDHPMYVHYTKIIHFIINISIYRILS